MPRLLAADRGMARRELDRRSEWRQSYRQTRASRILVSVATAIAVAPAAILPPPGFYPHPRTWRAALRRGVASADFGPLGCYPPRCFLQNANIRSHARSA